MKQIILSSLLVWMAFETGAHAQAAYAGSYNSMAGYTSGSYAGYFGYGITTVSRNGSASYTEYWPTSQTSDRGTGRVDANGRFTLTGGVTGSALFPERVGDNRVYALGFDGESASVAAEIDVGAQRDLLSSGTSVYATSDDTVRRWDFSENTGFFSSPFSWKVPGSGFITQLEILGGTPWAVANSTLYRLQANGQVTDFGELPGWPDLKKIRSDGASSALPTGPYGSKKIN